MSTPLKLEISSREPKTYSAPWDICTKFDETKKIYTVYQVIKEDAAIEIMNFNRKKKTVTIVSKSDEDARKRLEFVDGHINYQDLGWISLPQKK